MKKSPWWTIGWRNIGRNKRRTLITAAALAGGYFAIVVMVGLSRGIVAEMIANGTDLTAGQLQVHNPDYLPDKTIYDTFGGRGTISRDSLIALVEADPAVTDAAPRVYAGALVASEDKTLPGLLMGIDVDLERSVSRIVQLNAGRLPTRNSNEVVVGSEMARQLEVGIGDTIVVMAPSIDGSMGNDLYDIVGTYHSGIVNVDATTVLISLESLQYLVYMDPAQIHEIAAVIPDPWQAPAAAERIATAIAATGDSLDVVPWTELRPEMVEYANLVTASEFIIVIIVFGMAIFGVANTMLMAAYERRREFALLLALGASPWVIIKSVVSEALSLGIISLIAGAAITMPVLVWWHVAPVDLSGVIGGFEMTGSYVSPVLRVEYPWNMIFVAAASLFVTAVIAATYPAIKSARLPPVDTLAGR